MTNARVSIVLATVALFIAVVALVHTLRPSGPPAGRLLQLTPVRSYQTRMPISYLLDDFELMKLEDGSFVALYIYPSGFFGHTQGCTIRWEPTATLQGTLYPSGLPAGTPVMPPAGGTPVSAVGLWVEGCSGSKWDAAGHRLYGPSADLDHFSVSIRNGTVWVDTRHLQCAPGHACVRVHRVGR
jgi:hypothetical protein